MSIGNDHCDLDNLVLEGIEASHLTVDLEVSRGSAPANDSRTTYPDERSIIVIKRLRHLSSFRSQSNVR
jgi:hypothetical protein